MILVLRFLAILVGDVGYSFFGKDVANTSLAPYPVSL